MDCLDQVFRENSEWINIYQGIETVDDPYEKNVTVSLLPPKAIKAMVNDVAFAKIQWAMPGIKTSKAKQIVIKKQYKSLLENSQIIGIKDNHTEEQYCGWRENSKMQYKVEGNYIRAYIYIK